MNKAITDTGPPLHLNQIGYLRLFNIFEKIVVSRQVKDELLKFGAWPLFSKEMARHLQEEIVTDDEITKEQGKRKDLLLHKTDFSVLVLMCRMMDALALTDDLGLRKAIESLGRVVVGSIGILIRGFRDQKISKDELRRGIDLLFNDSSLYLSSAFRIRVLKLIEEIM